MTLRSFVSATLLLYLGNAFSLEALSQPVPLKPGLWRVQMKMKQDGKDFDPQAKIDEALKQLPPGQRAQMLEMMKKQGISTAPGSSGFEVCYTEEALARGNSLNADGTGQCESAITHQSATELRMTLKCKDGSQGKGEWKIGDSSRYLGHFDMTRPNGQRFEMAQEGKFVNADCGSVKPLSVKN